MEGGGKMQHVEDAYHQVQPMLVLYPRRRKKVLDLADISHDMCHGRCRRGQTPQSRQCLYAASRGLTRRWTSATRSIVRPPSISPPRPLASFYQPPQRELKAGRIRKPWRVLKYWSKTKDQMTGKAAKPYLQQVLAKGKMCLRLARTSLRRALAAFQVSLFLDQCLRTFQGVFTRPAWSSRCGGLWVGSLWLLQAGSWIPTHTHNPNHPSNFIIDHSTDGARREAAAAVGRCQEGQEGWVGQDKRAGHHAGGPRRDGGHPRRSASARGRRQRPGRADGRPLASGQGCGGPPSLRGPPA